MKTVFIADELILRDLDIGGVWPFDVNSDPSSVGTERK